MKTFIKSQFAYGTSGRRPVTLIGLKGILFLFLFTLSLNAQVSSYLVHSKEDTNQKCNHFNEFLKDKVKVDKLIALDISIDENNYLKISPNGKSHILNRATDESFIEKYSDIFGIQSNMSFKLLSERKSQFDSNTSFKKFQQYYKGIRIKGGFFIEVVTQLNHNRQKQKLNKIIPKIASEVNISIIPKIKETDLYSILNTNSIIEKELIIVNEDCNFNLVWEVKFIGQNYSLAYIDAQNGKIISETDLKFRLNANTINYGEKNLDDIRINGTSYMTSSDGVVTTRSKTKQKVNL